MCKILLLPRSNDQFLALSVIHLLQFWLWELNCFNIFSSNSFLVQSEAELIFNTSFSLPSNRLLPVLDRTLPSSSLHTWQRRGGQQSHRARGRYRIKSMSVIWGNIDFLRYSLKKLLKILSLPFSCILRDISWPLEALAILKAEMQIIISPIHATQICALFFFSSSLKCLNFS